jgi:LmbE family N-acetylglucosaminyl deacetylase
MGESPAVLLVGAHAADMEFTAGAIAAKYAQAGWRVVLLHCTLGERGHPTLSAAAYADQKRREALEAARRLGAEARFLGYPDGELPEDDTVALALADVIREVRPTVVVTHWAGSIHQDHTRTAHNTERALFLAGLRTLERERPAYEVDRLYYAENWEDPDGYRPDVYVDTTAVHETWRQAASCYEIFRGAAGFRYGDYYESLAVMRGCLAGCARAVALMRPPGTAVARHLGPALP